MAKAFWRHRNTRSNHWEYLAAVLFGLGIALAISGSITHFYYQQHPGTKPQYDSYPIPLLIAGICITTLGALALSRSKAKRKAESELLPPPPPPPFPPPPSPSPLTSMPSVTISN